MQNTKKTAVIAMDMHKADLIKAIVAVQSGIIGKNSDFMHARNLANNTHYAFGALFMAELFLNSPMTAAFITDERLLTVISGIMVSMVDKYKGFDGSMIYKGTA